MHAWGELSIHRMHATTQARLAVGLQYAIVGINIATALMATIMSATASTAVAFNGVRAKSARASKAARVAAAPARRPDVRRRLRRAAVGHSQLGQWCFGLFQLSQLGQWDFELLQ